MKTLKFSEIEVNETNLMEVIKDNSVCIIAEDANYDDGRFSVIPIRKVSIEQILSEDTMIVRIENLE